MKPLAWLIALMLAAPAHAEWKAANPGVTEAAKDPRVAAVLAEIDKTDAAIVAGDKAGFMSKFAPEIVVNNPFNQVSNLEEVERRFVSGQIAYEYLRRSIEYAGPRGSDEVVLMGEETYKPRPGAAHAGQVVRRRFTDLWRLHDGKWRLSLRQATIFATE